MGPEKEEEKESIEEAWDMYFLALKTWKSLGVLGADGETAASVRRLVDQRWAILKRLKDCEEEQDL